MDTENYIWVGLTQPRDVGPNKALITPLAFYDHETDTWESVDHGARKHYFPNDGKVIVFEREWAGHEPNRIYRFQPEPNTQSTLNPESPGFAKYWVRRPLSDTSLSCVLDWSASTTTVNLPAAFAERSPFLDVPTHRIYIRHGAQIYGPIQLDPISRHPREYMQSTDTGGPPLMVKVYSFASQALFHITVNDERIALLDEDRLNEPRGEADWSLPQVVLKRVLDASKKLTPNELDGSALVDRRIKELASVASERGPEAFKLSPSTVERAKRIVSNQQAVLAALDDIDDTILGLPALKPQIEAAIAAETLKHKGEIERAANAQLADELSQLAQTQTAVTEARAQLDALNAEITAAQALKERQTQEFAAFESALVQRLESLRTEPMQALADLQLTSLLLPTLMEHRATTAPTSNGNRETRLALAEQSAAAIPDVLEQTIIPREHFGVSDVHSALEWCGSASALADHSPTALKSQWSSIGRRFGARSKDVRVGAASLLAGLIPVPSGSGARLALRAFANMFAGGRIWTIPVSVTTLGTSDLFGAVDEVTHRFIPTAGALADIVLAAREHPDDLGLVIFEGLDRVPGMPTYAPLLRHYEETQRHILGGPATVPLNLFHPRAFAPDDPYAALAQFSWPSNLLIAAILDEAESSFPVPFECENWMICPVTNLARLREDPVSGIASAINFSEWRNWRRDVYRNAKGDEPTEFFSALLRESLRALGSAKEEIEAFIEAYGHDTEED